MLYATFGAEKQVRCFAALVAFLIVLPAVEAGGATEFIDREGDEDVYFSPRDSPTGTYAETLCRGPSADVLTLTLTANATHLGGVLSMKADIDATTFHCRGVKAAPTDSYYRILMWTDEHGVDIAAKKSGDQWLSCAAIVLIEPDRLVQDGCQGSISIASATFSFTVPRSGNLSTPEGEREYALGGEYELIAYAITQADVFAAGVNIGWIDARDDVKGMFVVP